MREPGQAPRADEAALHERWQRLALDVLVKDGELREDATPAEVEPALRTRLPDGLDVEVLYTNLGGAPEPGFPGSAPFLRGSRPAGAVVTGWDRRAFHDDPDPRAANEAIREDLERGATSLWLRLGSDAIPPEALRIVLDGVPLEEVPIALDAGAAGPGVATGFLRLVTDRGLTPGAVRGTLGLDPLGMLVRTGTPPDLEPATRLAAELTRTQSGLRAITVDAGVQVDLGASDTEELGCSIAGGIIYLRALIEAGLDVDAACRQLEFRYVATQDQFLTIAKLRAARRLWGRVTEVLGASGSASAQVQHVVASPAMLTQRDPWVNLLRVTVAAFAAGVGGADAITALPFDQAIGRSDAFARRLARNTVTLLEQEAELASVVDPAGGSWYVEQLTDRLAHEAWALTQEVERLRGRPDALASGLVAERVAKTRVQRLERLRRRLDPITGVSRFADPDEEPVVRPRRPAPAEPVARRPRLPLRHAEPFESLRDRADAAPEQPVVFLATLGPLSAHTARAAFAADLFAAGGIRAESAGPTETVEDVLTAYRRHPRPVACFCGTDDAYTASVEPVAAALREEGVRALYVAGRPSDQDPAWRAAGVSGYLAAGCDAIQVLEQVLAACGVP